jgi:radical SAM protein with 4Fe4S-binding SPASM domain
LKCLHCYSSSGPASQSDELTTAEAKLMLNQAAAMQCPVVLFSGGEPMLRGDLFELLTEAKRLNLRAVLSSNGTLIDEPAAKKLAEAAVSYVGISIDGKEQFHDRFRRTRGCFKAAIRGIENCREAGIKTGLRFTITKSNADHVSAVFDIAASAGVRRICFYHLIRSGRAKELQSQTLTAEQTRHIVDVIIDKTREFVCKKLVDEVLTVDNHADGPYLLVRMKRQNNLRYGEAQKLLLANGGNKIGEKIVCVGWNGDVYPDQFWRNYSLGNVKEETLRNIWQNSSDSVLNRLRNKSNFADKKCRRCRWFSLCKGNFRFLGADAEDRYWLNEPACYLTDEETGKEIQK